jgi:hypothetical protein
LILNLGPNLPHSTISFNWMTFPSAWNNIAMFYQNPQNHKKVFKKKIKLKKDRQKKNAHQK